MGMMPFMDQFTCEFVKENGVFIIRPTGYLNEEGGVAIRNAIEEAFESGHLKYVLNCAKAPVINSPGVAQLIEITEIIVEERSCKIAYVGLTDLTKGLFKMTGLLKLGACFPDETSAINSF